MVRIGLDGVIAETAGVDLAKIEKLQRIGS